MSGIGLFALAGFGNSVLRALCRAGHVPRFLVTRREPGPFPYYPEIDLLREADALGVPHFFGTEGESYATAMKPDLLLVATYHRILSPRVCHSAKQAFNFHPSLLPCYRGPNPFYWALRNGDKRTGLTVHAISAAVDAGEIFWQRAIDIAIDETQGSLRRRLADVAAAAAVEIIEQYNAGRLIGRSQDETKASYFPAPTDADRMLDLTQDLTIVERAARALMPYPGAIAAGRTVTAIIDTHPGNGDCQIGSIHIDGQILRARVRDGEILFACRP